jgi:uncharacterized membrane-anchored protein YjiN (DUF445 family)
MRAEQSEGASARPGGVSAPSPPRPASTSQPVDGGTHTPEAKRRRDERPVVETPSVPIAGSPSDDAVREERLRSMKRRATALLIACGVIFIITRLLEPSWPWLGYVRATAEAALVGGLADWFAVTALFRHPLRIPIPHTAIIPARKDRIGRTLGRFVENNFLSPAVIASRIHAAHPAERMAKWLSDPENGAKIARHVAAGVSGAAHALRDEEVRRLIEQGVARRARAVPVAPIVGSILATLTSGRRHQELLDETLRLAARSVSENQELIRQRIREESPWWLPEAIDDRIHEKVIGAIERTLAQVARDPGHPLRSRFDHALTEFIEDLRTSPDTIARAEQLKEEVLSHPAIRDFSASVWDDAKAALVRRAARTESSEPDALEHGLSALAQTVVDDPVLLQKIDGWILDAVLYMVEQYRHEVAHLIEHTVANWDPDATSRRIELQIGRDLQFIRINGTLVGGLVGLILYTVSQLV